MGYDRAGCVTARSAQDGCIMIFAVLSTMLALFLDLLHAVTCSEHDKTIEIAVLRHQLRLFERTASRKPRLSRWDKLVLATIVANYRALARALVLVKPE